MQLLNWNISHGGGRRRRAILKSACSYDADVIVLTEYRAAPDFLRAFACRGYAHQHTSDPPSRSNGIAVLSRTPIEVVPTTAAVPTTPRGRWLEVRITDLELYLIAIYLPGKTSPTGRDGKRAFWAAIHEVAERYRDQAALIVGDLNTGAHLVDEDRATLYCSDDFVALEQALGWHDAWRLRHGRRRDYTWWSRGKAGGSAMAIGWTTLS